MSFGLLGLLGNAYYNNKATSAINKGNEQAVGAIKDYYNEGKGYLSPFWNTGTQANSGIQALLGGDYSGFYNAPDFQARMKAGGDMFDSSAAARGGVFGGGATRGREMYAQQLAAQGLGDYRNWLGNVSGMGMQAGSNIGQLGAAAGNSIASLYGDMGKNRASNYQARGSNLNDLYGNIGSSIFSMMGY